MEEQAETYMDTKMRQTKIEAGTNSDREEGEEEEKGKLVLAFRRKP